MSTDITDGTVVRYDGDRAVVLYTIEPPAWVGCKPYAAVRFLDSGETESGVDLDALEALEVKPCQHGVRGTAPACTALTAPGEDVCPEHGGLPYDA